jgi:CcmD family protein
MTLLPRFPSAFFASLGALPLPLSGLGTDTLLAFAAHGPPGERSQGWQADAGGGGISGGGLLLMAAYAAIWLVAFGLIALSLLRQSRMNARLDHLAAELSAAGERAAAGPEVSPKAEVEDDAAPKPLGSVD